MQKYQMFWTMLVFHLFWWNSCSLCKTLENDQHTGLTLGASLCPSFSTLFDHTLFPLALTALLPLWAPGLSARLVPPITLVRTFWHSKISPPHFARPFFFYYVVRQIICSTKFYPWHVGFLCSWCAAEKLNKIWVPLNKANNFTWNNYECSDGSWFLLGTKIAHSQEARRRNEFL